MSRVAAVLAILAGVGLIAFPIATSLFSHTAGAERITDAFRPAMTREGLATTRADFETVRDGGVEFITKAEPAFARDLKLTPVELDAFIGSNFPAVATAVKKIPGYNSYVGSYIGRLERNRTNFEAADSLPLLGLPIDATWLMAGIGALLALAGLLGLRTTGPGRQERSSCSGSCCSSSPSWPRFPARPLMRATSRSSVATR